MYVNLVFATIALYLKVSFAYPASDTVSKVSEAENPLQVSRIPRPSPASEQQAAPPRATLEDTVVASTSQIKNPKDIRTARSERLEKKRRMKVERVAQAYDDLKAKVLYKDPLKLSRSEQLKVLAMRYQLQRSIDNLARYKEPYVNNLREGLKVMRDGLTRQSDYLDTTSEAYKAKRKHTIRNNRNRFRTRRKVRQLGIEIKLNKQGSLKDGAPPLIMKKRARNAAWRQRDKEKKLEFDRLLKEGWGTRKIRTKI